MFDIIVKRRIIVLAILVISLTATACESTKDKNNSKVATKSAASSSTSTRITATTKPSATTTKKLHATTTSLSGEKDGSEVILDKVTKKKLNVFLSNFSEVYLESFKQGEIKNQELIKFGVLHNIINNYKTIKNVDGSDGKIAASHITSSVKKYFGINTVKHESWSWVKYKNGYYEFPLADGESRDFSQVTKLTDCGNNILVAYFSTYSNPAGALADPYEPIQEWSEADRELLDLIQLTGTGKATIKKTGSSYLLLDYMKF